MSDCCCIPVVGVSIRHWRNTSDARLSRACLRPAFPWHGGRSQGHSGTHREVSSLVPWLQQRGEADAHSTLTIGYSPEGRALFTARPIKTGERVLRVTRELIITPDRLPRSIADQLPEVVNAWSRLALFLLLHQRAGKASPWAPYIKCLPPSHALHSTVFWRDEELALIRDSAVHDQTLLRQVFIESQFTAAQPALMESPVMMGESVTLDSFTHAYCIACSRSWGIEALGSIAMVPFVDFLNHDSHSRALLAYYEDEGFAEVVADKDYDLGSQMMITYGSLPNSALALDFGFTVPHNPHDQVDFWMDVPPSDPLCAEKLELLHQHGIETECHHDGSDSGGAWFSLREVSSPAARGKGIPRTLRTFSRVVSATCIRDLEVLAVDARRRQGKLAQRPLKDGREARALKLLLNRVDSCIKSHTLAIKRAENVRIEMQISKERAEMARAVLAGELRVLRSVGAWLRPRAEGGGFDSLCLQ